MRPAHRSPWVRSLVHAAGTAFLLLAAAPALAAPRSHAVAARGHDAVVRERLRPAVPAQAQGIPHPITSGRWTQLGPFNQPGRMNGVVSHILVAPWLDAFSDGYGYWQGYAWTNIDWEDRGRQMGVGIEQGIRKLVFPPVGDYFERLSVECTDGSLRYSDDDGATWSPVQLNLDPSEEPVPGNRRLLASDLWSNVTYLVTRYYDSFAADTFTVLMISYDSGATYDALYDFAGSRYADAWVSQDGSGQIVIAYSADYWDDTTVQSASEDGWSFAPFSNPAATSNEFTYPGLQITAQCQLGVVSRVWVLRGDQLTSTTDDGDTWVDVRDAWVPAGPRGLCASILSTDVLTWTDSETAEMYGKLYTSTDGGTTAHWIENQYAWGETERPHQVSTNVQSVRWNFAPALTVRERSRDGATLERAVAPRIESAAAPHSASGTGNTEYFYIASGGGIWIMTPGDTTASLLTGDISNQQVNDVATLHQGDPNNTYTATRDNDLLRTYTTPFGCDAYHSVISGIGTSVSDVATAYGRQPDDWSYYAQFAHCMFLFGGGGPFTGVFTEGYTIDVRHRFVTQDPTQWNVAYAGFDHLQRMTYELATNSITVTDVSSPMQATFGGIAGFGLAPSQTNYWYLALHDGTLLWSHDSGTNWYTAIGAAPPVMDPAQLARVKIVVNPEDPFEAWCMGRGIVHTTDGGQSWTDASGGLPSAETIVFDAAYDGTALNRLYLATEAGAYRAGGGVFVPLQEPGMPVVQFRAVEAVPYLGIMRFGTWGAGLWDYDAANPLAAPPAEAVTLALAPARNPVRGAAQLAYALPRAGQVTLEVLDVAGRRVATLVDGVRPAGRAVAEFDAAGMGAGVWFARLRSADGVRTTKFVVTK
ncbi:MAG: hypothetical protein U0704_04990 [Candidatus Eisenbacteria bacterium]